jgi:hypothetical protein
MDHNLSGSQDYLRMRDSAIEDHATSLPTCAECGHEVINGYEVDDQCGDCTAFCSHHLPKCEIGRMIWVDTWFRRFVHMTNTQRSKLIIKKIA